MIVEIATKGLRVEKVNYLLSLAIESAKTNPDFLKQADLTIKDIDDCEVFRKQLVRGYLKHFKKKKAL